jgi:hypothetical protein
MPGGQNTCMVFHKRPIGGQIAGMGDTNTNPGEVSALQEIPKLPRQRR